MKNIKSAINKGLKFLSKNQKKDGSFMCLVSTNFDDYRASKSVPAIVPTNIVLSSLIRLSGKSQMANNIKKKAADFLFSERSEYWAYNYWFRKSKWFSKEPYPDDLDDTFCALAALYEYKPEAFDGEAMAKIATMLTSAEAEEGGPYDMWLVPPSGRDKWNDIDLVVNSNIAYFLYLQGISLPKVNAFIEKSIETADYDFPYNTIYPGAYFISRFYRGKLAGKIIELLLLRQEQDGKWENPLRTALAISVLINLSGGKHRSRIEKGIGYLLSSQNRNGFWKPSSFYFQMKTPQKTLYAGSSSITTALVLEALNKWEALNKPESRKNNLNALKKQIFRKVLARFSHLNSEIICQARKIIAKTFKSDKDSQIALLPYFFKNALGSAGKNISGSLLAKLGEANIFGWIAYSIYDDFLDGEGDARLLSLANISLRESIKLFSESLPKETKFGEFAEAIFDTIDSANAWEVMNCRDGKIPDYGNYEELANKSLGHALPAAAILFSLGYGRDSKELKNLMGFFKYYIIARQLNDDAHDWEDDLERGHINAVSAKIFKKLKTGEPIARLQEEFWNKTIPQTAREISAAAKLARSHLEKIPIMENSDIFGRFISAIEASAEKALIERKNAMQFIKNYKSK